MEKSQSSQEVSKRPSVMHAAAAMSLGTLASRVLGLLRDIIPAAIFPRTVTDAFIVAFRLPNLFRRLLGEGSLAVSFIPVYVEKKVIQAGESPEQANARAAQLADAMYSLLLSVVGILSVLGILFMRPIMAQLVGGEGLIADLIGGGKGFKAVEGKFELTVFFGQIMFAYLFLVTTYAYFTAIANVHKKFLVPALAPAFFNATFIIFALFPAHWGRVPGEFLAWGVIAGGLVQVGVVMRLLFRLGHLPRLRWRWKTPGVGLILRNMLPGIVGMGILQLMSLANVAFASRLPEGAHSYIYWADRILELPQSLIAISMGAALLPELSDLWSRGAKQQMRETASRHLRLLLFLALPSAVGMYALAQPIVEVLFMRGEFDLSDAASTASVVKVYSVLLVVSSLNKVIVPSFYAIKNTWLPALVTVISLGIHLWLADKWIDSFGLQGLVASTTFAGLINLVLLALAFRFFVGPLQWIKLLLYCGRLAPSLVTLGAFALVVYPTLMQFLSPFIWPSFARLLALMLAIAGGVLIYFTVSRWTKVEERGEVLALLRRRRQRAKK